MRTTYSWRSNHERTPERGSLSHALMTVVEEDEWLLYQFSRCPFLLYKIWLIINTPVILIVDIYVLSIWYEENFEKYYPSVETALLISFTFTFYGCCQMMYAIRKKNSRIAQQGFAKFQYAVFGSLRYLIPETPELKGLDAFGWLFLFEVVFPPIIHLIGGSAVLQVFKKNHPLARLSTFQVPEDSNQDFLEQNEAIASEFSKYDQHLRRWPYFIYKWFLKGSVIFELLILLRDTLPCVYTIWQNGIDNYDKMDFWMYPFLIIWAVSSLLNTYACSQMETAMRTRNLAMSKRALALLKICIVLSIIKCLFLGKCFELVLIFYIEGKMWVFWFACSEIIPAVGLVGALKVNKIIEERENFVKFSCYSQDRFI